MNFKGWSEREIMAFYHTGKVPPSVAKRKAKAKPRKKSLPAKKKATKKAKKKAVAKKPATKKKIAKKPARKPVRKKAVKKAPPNRLEVLAATYSADKIAFAGKKTPVVKATEINGKLLTATGSSTKDRELQEVWAHELVPRSKWNGKVYKGYYSLPPGVSYRGLLVKFQGDSYVMGKKRSFTK